MTACRIPHLHEITVMVHVGNDCLDDVIVDVTTMDGLASTDGSHSVLVLTMWPGSLWQAPGAKQIFLIFISVLHIGAATTGSSITSTKNELNMFGNCSLGACVFALGACDASQQMLLAS